MEPENYLFFLKYLGDNTIGVMYGDAEAVADNFPTESEWVKHEFAFKVICEGNVEVGVRVDSPAMYGKVRDEKAGGGRGKRQDFYQAHFCSKVEECSKYKGL